MPGEPVVLETLGGLVATARPEDIPEGASPRTYDTDFIVGRFIQRPGLENQYSFEGALTNATGTAAASLPVTGNPWSNPGNILANDGSYAVAAMPTDLRIVSVQSFSALTTPQPNYFALVTFATPVAPSTGGQIYVFSGLTTFTTLNGQNLGPLNTSYPYNSLLPVPAANQALFGFGTGVIPIQPDTADTGIASITPWPGPFTSDQIRVEGFGFTLPSTSNVTGIPVTVRGFAPSATLYAQLLKSGTPVGEIKSLPLPTSPGNITFGGPLDPWEESWLYSDIDSTTFGVIFWATVPTAQSVSLDFCQIGIYGSASNANFTGLVDANLDEIDQSTLALDANGLVWQEDVTNAPNVLVRASQIPVIQPGSYMKGLDANGKAYLAFSDLIQGTSQPMQYNGLWADRITQVGPGAPPSFAAAESAGTQVAVTAWTFSAGILTLTTGTQSYTAGELVTFSGFTGGLIQLNGLTFSILGTGLTTTQIEIAVAPLTFGASGSDTGTATPQYTYPIVASPNGITQPAAYSDPGNPGHLSVLLWSAGPGSTTVGNTITVYYQSSFNFPTPDQTLVNAFNAGNPVYVYISGAPFGNGTWQVTSIGNDLPPHVDHWRYYFTIQVPTTSYQFATEPLGQYEISQATVTTTTPVPGLAAGDQVSLAGVTNPAWDGLYTVVSALNSGSYSITQTQLTAGTATYTWALISGSPPAAGDLVTVTNTLNANGALNVTNAVIATATGGIFTVDGFSNAVDYPVTVETGQAVTAGTEFIIDPGAALAGTTTPSPILGNSGDGTLTVVGAASGGTFPIGAGTRQGVVFFITRNGAVTKPSPPSTFTVTTGSNYITASQIPLGPPNVVARGIAFTEAGANGVPGANFYTYDTSVTFTVNGIVYTASALIVPDNVTTTMKFTFSDSVLLASDEIDIPGNNYFNLIEIGSPTWMYQYANRMLYGLCQTQVHNFLNMSFDGGYLPTGNNSFPLPLGWKNNGGNLPVTIPVTAFSITSNVVTFSAVNGVIIGLQFVVTGLSTGTYLNNVPMTILSRTNTTISASFTHADVTLTTDSGTIALTSSAFGLVPSPDFGDCIQLTNFSTLALTEGIFLFQSAYQDVYGVPILQPNTAYSVRLKARVVSGSTASVFVGLNSYANGAFGQVYASALFHLVPGNFLIQTLPLTTGIAVIPQTLVLTVGEGSIPVGASIQIDRIEVFPTNNPVDTTTIWTSYVGNFEAVDGVTGSLGVGVDNPQAAQGAYQILEQLFIEKTGSRCVTQDSPNYEPSNWKVSLSSQGVGAVGPNAFYSDEEFSISANRPGEYLFDGGKPMPISRELQSSGTNASVWETINWAAKQTIWSRFDTTQRKLYIGVPMITPNFWLPNAPSLTPTTPNVILMCNFTGCPTAGELEMSAPVHTTMFGDLKSLDMRRKWSIWQVPCPAAEFITRADGTRQLFLCNGISSSKIYALVPGAASGGQNTDDGQTINWNYTTYGFTKAKQGQQNPALGALRKVWYYFAATMEGIGKVACKLYSNTLGALPQNTFTVQPPFTLTYPQQNDQETNLEIGGQRVFIEFTASGSGYAEIGPVLLDGEMDKNAPHRGVRS